MAARRAIDPNMPPSYDQAVTGQDQSVKVEDGVKDVPSGKAATLPPPPQYTPGAATAAAAGANPSAPTAPLPPVEEQDDDNIDDSRDDRPLLA